MDPREFEQDVSAICDLLIEEEREDFRERIVPFSQTADALRLETTTRLRQFYTTLTYGFIAICEGLQDELHIDEQKWRILDDFDACMKAFKEGRSICQLLGFSNDMLTRFYEASCKLKDEKHFDKAVDAFSFLTLIAPHVASFWFELAVCSCELKAYEKADEAFLKVIEIDPSREEAYIGALHSLLQQNKLVQAKEFCDKGIAICRENKQAAWAENIKETLVAAQGGLI